MTFSADADYDPSALVPIVDQQYVTISQDMALLIDNENDPSR